ncbi:DNA-binding response regulator [Gluconacetobacter liquefaciens]|uniref:DNA-binding response OmpR family regulator n=3 Tax=Gluconacetobacter liquefaciens TaxID=89584 RepID=A0A370G7C3_GLULI|nr:DNA-binding response OmpR family regulator [Gluconacetobacter liquefaciens]GBQ99498.1 two component response regulator [Gluconacetobacter liquefaciens NRIC 0522]GEB36340.1 DNA-binding response regulator [Gluconacetobacter liquefaciens]
MHAMIEEHGQPRPQVLLVEDDHETARYIADAPMLAHIDLAIVHDGQQGRDRALARDWDCIILDRRLPGLDGLSILGHMRDTGVQTPVLFLTTMDGIHDRVTGLRNGADDYLVKPFSLSELTARLDNLLRRTKHPLRTTRLSFADVTIDLLAREVHRAGTKLYIQAQELKLLEYFMRHPGVIISQAMLLQAVWDIDFPLRTNLVESHISRLRVRLGRDAPPLIHTIRNRGYVLRRE